MHQPEWSNAEDGGGLRNTESFKTTRNSKPTGSGFIAFFEHCVCVSMAPPRADMKMNAIRSGIVVLGALAFGYLSLQIGFKPYLEKAQQQNVLLQSDSEPEQQPSSSSQELYSFPERSS
ncbi:hypothetical protein PIB30_035241 [Stylosanthes scabra]|uniref:Uncharacterized protein n=1 Tax=Stylosanthes scabra TaxID=79078 RepID=A0ABU6UBS8_9FABA|nr:hypothetical protein [Stylosanthes scabra]